MLCYEPKSPSSSLSGWVSHHWALAGRQEAFTNSVVHIARIDVAIFHTGNRKEESNNFWKSEKASED